MNGRLLPMSTSGRARRAFTLVELLAAMTVLIAMVVMFSLLVSNAARVTNRSGRLMDADSQARLVFDRMAADFARFNRLGGMDSIFAKSNGGSNPSDRMFFFGSGPGFYPGTPLTSQDNSGLSLIGYRINAAKLERLGKTLTWTGGFSGSSAPGAPLLLSFSPGTFSVLPQSTVGFAYASTVGSPSNNYSGGTDGDYHVLGEQVFRFEYCFLLTDGTMSNLPLRDRAADSTRGLPKWTVSVGQPSIGSDSSSAQGYAAGPVGAGTASLWFDSSSGAKRTYRCAGADIGAAAWAPGGLEGVSAIVVAIAVLDNASQQMNVNAAALASSLPDPTDAELSSPSPVTMAVRWNKTIFAPGFASAAGIPPMAASSIRVYQRVFYLNP